MRKNYSENLTNLRATVSMMRGTYPEMLKEAPKVRNSGKGQFELSMTPEEITAVGTFHEIQLYLLGVIKGYDLALRATAGQIGVMMTPLWMREKEGKP
jgi:hypothetical protein